MTIQFVYPKPGDQTRDLFDVQIHIDTADSQAFSEHYGKGGSICLSLDDSAYSCWPIFELKKLPRFTQVRDGSHRMRGVLRLDGILLLATAGETTFVSSAETETPALPAEPQQQAEPPNKPPDPEAPREEVKIPQVNLVYPAQLSTVGRNFEASLEVLTTEAMDKFKRLFENGFMCLSMDGAANACWPLFVDSYTPSFNNLREGRHTLVAHLSHPETGKLVLGSSMGATTFYSLAQDDGAGPGSRGAGGGDAPDPTAMVQVQPDGSTTTVIHVVIDGRAVPFMVGLHEEPMSKAQQFCASNKIVSDECASQLVERLKLEREAGA
eukprot:g1842.t1